MDWSSFFIGATVMLFVLVTVILLIPLKDRKETERWREQEVARFFILREYWEKANELAAERNQILRGDSEKK